MDENEQLQIMAIISCIFSGLVMLTLIMFPSMRSRLFMRIIAFISLCDFLGNLPYTTTHRPETSSPWCSIEGFVNMYFYPASWLWTTILVYFLYALAITGKVPLSETAVHLICWGLPMITTLLVLTTNNFTRFDINDDNEVCTIGGDETSAFIWRVINYYGLFVLCVVIMISLFITIIRIRKEGTSAVSVGILNLAIESLQLYPLAMLISWTPEFISFIIEFDEENALLFHIAVLLKISNGLLTSIIFFSKSEHARMLWSSCLTGTSRFTSRIFSHDSSSILDIAEEFSAVDSAHDQRKLSVSLLSDTASTSFMTSDMTKRLMSLTPRRGDDNY